jgi:hypothetical protein
VSRLGIEFPSLDMFLGLMQSLVTNTPSFNPETFLDLLSYLDPLENIYAADRSTLLSNLESCLAATSANVTTVCGPIIDNQATGLILGYSDGVLVGGDTPTINNAGLIVGKYGYGADFWFDSKFAELNSCTQAPAMVVSFHARRD